MERGRSGSGGLDGAGKPHEGGQGASRALGTALHRATWSRQGAVGGRRLRIPWAIEREADVQHGAVDDHAADEIGLYGAWLPIGVPAIMPTMSPSVTKFSFRSLSSASFGS